MIECYKGLQWAFVYFTEFTNFVMKIVHCFESATNVNQINVNVFNNLVIT